jgi:transcriptional regulator with XRE-family HTH domain
LGRGIIKRKKSSFGRLLAAHRSYNGISQTELQRLLREDGFTISIAAITKYEYGDRDPPAGFVYHAARILNLGEAQIAALTEARSADITRRFLDEYNWFVERAGQEKSALGSDEK